MIHAFRATVNAEIQAGQPLTVAAKSIDRSTSRPHLPYLLTDAENSF
jgi:hypothetical protein